MFSDWLTLDTLKTLAGATLFLRIVIEHTKGDVDRWTGNRVPTLYYALLLSWAILFGGSALNGELTASTAFLNVVNGFVMTVVAKYMETPSKAK